MGGFPREKAKRRVKWLAASFTRKMIAVIEGDLIIVDKTNKAFNLGQAQSFKMDSYGILGIWAVPLTEDIDSAHLYIQSKPERICCRPYQIKLSKGDVFDFKGGFSMELLVDRR